MSLSTLNNSQKSLMMPYGCDLDKKDSADHCLSFIHLFIHSFNNECRANACYFLPGTVLGGLGSEQNWQNYWSSWDLYSSRVVVVGKTVKLKKKKKEFWALSGEIILSKTLAYNHIFLLQLSIFSLFMQGLFVPFPRLKHCP